MENFEFAYWIVLLPFLSFALVGLAGSKLPKQFAGLLATTAIAISTVLSIVVAYNYFFTMFSMADYKPVIASEITWLHFTDSLSIKLGVLLDPISVMMLLVISIVSLMVFIYSLGYMKEEEGFNRYFSFLSLFSFSMLGLVVATNLFQMYMFWELVGVSSYLLIGFYYQKPEAVAASKKAFIVTRFADLGFLIGILILSYYSGTFDFILLTDPEGFASLHGITSTFLGFSALTWALILIFIGGAGKSAMFPLHIWLPDAMEGPTPVSALIHAATMVVAGVYLVARLFPLYSFGSPNSLEVVAFIGAFTTLFAAVIACTQADIKRILAFSTMSQIGYMMLALGVSGYAADGLGFTASLFHLFTHAFFKALLFLGAGAIIHAVHTNTIFEMGGLRKYQPITHITFLIACLAISGIPPFAGFFSKDEILSAAFASHPIYFGIALLVAGLTAFYMFRLYFIVFWGKEKVYDHPPHEAPVVMLIPMIVLAIGSVVAGFVPFGNFVSSNSQPFYTHLEWPVAIASVVVASIGIFTAWRFYKKESPLPEKTATSMGGLYTSAKGKFYIDELYLLITRNIIFQYVSRPIAWFDRNVIDATMNFISTLTNWISEEIKEFQSGQLQRYAFIFFAGVLILMLTFLYAQS
ncbi:MAG: NADH-quinone oxidoreductase subunit L [Flammeovirgaceae bacterium]|nr:NADH-quinone oxidoreductase subunit L [Flammeovirgaceae bacterium]